MKIKQLDIVLRRNKRGQIVALARQMTPEGLKYGTNLLKGRHPSDFKDARTLVQALMEHTVTQLDFFEESTEWE
jgi:hypothetical protein